MGTLDEPNADIIREPAQVPMGGIWNCFQVVKGC